MTDPLDFREIQRIADRFGMDALRLSLHLEHVRQQREIFLKMTSWIRTKRDWDELAKRIQSNAAALRKDLVFFLVAGTTGLYPQIDDLHQELSPGWDLVRVLDALVRTVNETDFSPTVRYAGVADNYLVGELGRAFLLCTDTPDKPTFYWIPEERKYGGEFVVFLSLTLPFFGISNAKVSSFARRYRRVTKMIGWPKGNE